jgi:hypothetical protein
MPPAIQIRVNIKLREILLFTLFFILNTYSCRKIWNFISRSGSGSSFDYGLLPSNCSQKYIFDNFGEKPFMLNKIQTTVMYNMDMNIPGKLACTVMPLIQEIKRNIVFRIYKSETTAYIPHYSRNRIAGHLLITIQKLISLKKYEGKCSNILEMLRQCIMNVI